METIPLELTSKASEENLAGFLESMRDEAFDDAHFKLLSICIEVQHIDALAVLDSIYEASVDHFYMERPSEDWSIAGAEAVIEGAFSGVDRFQAVKKFSEDVLEHTVVVGDVDHELVGPYFFISFNFEETMAKSAPFPPANVFIPQWAVARSGTRYFALANCRVDPDSDVKSIARRVWAAHEKFRQFDYGDPPQSPPFSILGTEEVGEARGFEERVGQALRCIREKRYEKIVLSRACDIRFNSYCEPLKLLNNLRGRFCNCHLFSIQNKNAESFIGATPERLISFHQGRFYTEAIAGSEPRGKTAREDAALAKALLASDKDLREHRHVTESICRRLQSLSVEVTTPDSPELFQLANVQHLRTPIEGKVPKGVHLLDFAEALHPTPAVGGTPREEALQDIRAWEPFARGLYAGLIGWFGPRGDGDLVVGLRSALVSGHRARLFAGAGIVEGSSAEKERRETDVKMGALLEALHEKSRKDWES